ncbi:UDP-N-acetylmuramoyl-tripeptide--D-alanyl-D-alanine ligase [Pedobacter foliorum]|uniref:UDP-N-acetylmuramoyl-tripeptide--D-alanyl-D- alanine ligase n=1 Tax=Pedobacter foliorum TaxID=2739058 RepID=UPI00156556EE|nr:UDP-N-acetylmuramoyl-tripeptide--D-alanyl-D-alanine ligase [Pedobacter foliorum]NRF38516.1 UDP-N-acetylmuramoyl-tripeptide--D-alanyl-D-alanine ligase [Pedobacter foliorum]
MTAIESLYQHYLKHPVICTDTRNITPGCLFFALRGDNFDANTFAEKALTNGAAYAIIDNLAYKTSKQCILVPDVLSTLQDLAKHHRAQLNIPVIGLTGSNGKTTTKELIKAVLSEKYKTFATKGNLNNHIGVPLSILSLTNDTEIAVIEMGANHQKEIEFLCTIAKPTHGLITNVGMAHLDGFGGFEGVKKGKAELYAYLKNNHGIAFINRNNPYLMEMNAAANLDKVVYFGTEATDVISGKLVKTDPLIEISWSDKTGSYETSVNLTGSYNFENILAAICIGAFFDVTPEQINKGLSGYFPNNNRSQITKTENNTVICDFYNANPSSMTAALNNISLLSASQKAVIIGDMFELGDESAEQHDLIAKQAEQLNVKTLVFIGKYFYTLKDKYKGNFFSTPSEAHEFLKENPIKDNMVLLKGSRGMALEQLLPLL